MRAKLSLLFLFIAVLFGCSKDEGSLELPSSSFVLDSEASTVTVEVLTDNSWSTINENEWCSLDNTSGVGNSEINISVTENTSGSDREASVFIYTDLDYKLVKIVQYSNSDTDVFTVPVIFHVLYDNMTDKSQYITQDCINELIEGVNKYYKSPVDLNVEFKLATEDEKGKVLAEPGIERVKVDDCEFDITEFMDYGNDLAVGLQWNMNTYVNVYVYAFESESEDVLSMGISHLPYTISSTPLDGLAEGDYYLNKSYTEDYAHCVSINNKCIYDRSTEIYYVPTDAIVTLSHELGHYLGLLHAFDDEETPTDYCADTPSYKRSVYDAWLASITNPAKMTFEELCKRTATDGSKFTARNIMDYAYCYSDEFTNNQRSRVRHVLNYSPLIPGPKKSRSKSNAESSVRPHYKLSNCKF